MNKVLVTGGTGFIGSKIVAELLKTRSRITLVVRNNSHHRLAFNNSAITVVTSDDLFRESRAWWQTVLSDVDLVIHAAWYAEPEDYQTSSINEVCRKGTVEMAAAAEQAGVKRFVGIGTCAEYASSLLPLGTEAPLLPSTPYASAKVATYQALSKLFSGSTTSFAWCRVFYTYGDGEHPSRLYQYLVRALKSGNEALLGDGNNVRDFLEVGEVAAQIVQVSNSTKIGPVNICSGSETTIRQFAEGLADEYGSRSQLRFGARPLNSFDPPYVVGRPEDLATIL